MRPRTCPICTLAYDEQSTNGDYVQIFCNRCGAFYTSRSVEDSISSYLPYGKRQRAIASSMVRERWHNTDAVLTPDKWPDLFYAHDLPVLEKADRYLTLIAERINPISSFFDEEISGLDVCAKCWAIDDQELHDLLMLLVDIGWLKCDEPIGYDDKGTYKITANGWKHIEELRNKDNTSAIQGFVAMWFDESVKRLYSECIAPAISDAGYPNAPFGCKVKANFFIYIILLGAIAQNLELFVSASYPAG